MGQKPAFLTYFMTFPPKMLHVEGFEGFRKLLLAVGGPENQLKCTPKNDIFLGGKYFFFLILGL